MSAIKPGERIERISSRRFGYIVRELAERFTGPRASRRKYIEAVLEQFAFAVGEKSANPAALEEIPGNVGLWTELDYVVVAWAKKAAKDLDKRLDGLL